MWDPDSVLRECKKPFKVYRESIMPPMQKFCDRFYGYGLTY